MSRLGVLFALTNKEVEDLKAVPEKKRYDYMSNKFEKRLFGTERACALDKAWYGIQLCLGRGKWRETWSSPFNIVVGGEYLVDNENELITLKNRDQLKDIIYYLTHFDLAEVLAKRYPEMLDRILKEDIKLPPYVTDLPYLQENCRDLRPFYENAVKEHMQVIFTVDL